MPARFVLGMGIAQRVGSVGARRVCASVALAAAQLGAQRCLPKSRCPHGLEPRASTIWRPSLEVAGLSGNLRQPIERKAGTIGLVNGRAHHRRRHGIGPNNSKAPCSNIRRHIVECELTDTKATDC